MFLKKFFLLLFIFPGIFVAAQTSPNIIYIMADDLGYGDLGCYGRKDYTTPNIDKLASQGVRFINAYAASPLCTPTRTSFMTGRYPARTPVGLREPLGWTRSDSAVGLTPDQTSIATLLKKNGYETFLVGKWHLGFSRESSPMKNGFDEFFGFHGGAIDYISHTDPEGNNDLYENGKPVKVNGYLTDILTEKAVDIISREHTKPFFLSIMFNAPHWPWQAPGDKAYPPGDSNWKKGGSPDTYAAMVKSMDDAIGTIMKTLEDGGLLDNTIVIFTSDNGGERYSDMGPYSGGKPILKEGGIRVPAIISWPEKIPAGSTNEQVTITMDWTATILAMTNTRPDRKLPLDGINLMPVITGMKRPITRTFYWRVFQRNQQKAIRDDYWKYLKDEKGEYLYYLFYDAGEKQDLKEREPQIFETLKNKYSEWEKTVLQPVGLGR
jgi:arylsulfatase A-like enzyme